MMSSISRSPMYLNAIPYATLGTFLFLFPEGLAPVFAGKGSAFMTIAAVIRFLEYTGLLDFSARPGGLPHFGSYLVIPLLFAFRKYGLGA